MSLYKNIASQKIAVYAHDTAADAPKTGDAANITAQISKDFGAAAATNDVNPTELDAVDHPGIYVFDLTQAETNADALIISAVSSTAGIAIDPVQIFTVDLANHGITAIGTAQSASATGLRLAAGEVFADDTPIGSTLWAFGSDQGYWQVRIITDYVGATDDATVAAWTVTPTGTITYKVFGSASGASLTDIGSAVWAASPRTLTSAANITSTGGTTVPQTGDAFARLGAPAGASVSADVAAVKTDTGNLVTRITATLFSGITSMAQWLGLIAGKQVGNATARTELQATGAGGGTFDETTDSVEAIRDRGDAAWGGGNGSGLTAIPWNPAWDAEVQSEVQDALDATIADSIPADGTRPSIASGIYMLTQFMLERSVAGTTMTVRKPDGTTALLTLTLNSATAPTSVTRAT